MHSKMKLSLGLKSILLLCPLVAANETVHGNLDEISPFVYLDNYQNNVSESNVAAAILQREVDEIQVVSETIIKQLDESANAIDRESPGNSLEIISESKTNRSTNYYY